MSEDRARRVAKAVWDRWIAGEKMGGLPAEIRPENLEQAYEAQRALDELAGPRAGWKIAATSPAGQSHLGVSGPLCGRLYRRFEVPSGGQLSVTGMGMRSAEPEFAFVMGDPLPSDAAPFNRDDVLAAVDTLRLTIEVPDSRFEDFASAGGPQLVADAACGGHFVLGPTIDAWRDLDLPTQSVRMLRGGEECSRGVGANVLGDPAAALAWLANELARLNIALSPGELVMTGASAPPIGVRAGDTIAADFEQLGRVEVTFTA
jgi:2-keto-4-pentenoate hydratase